MPFTVKESVEDGATYRTLTPIEPHPWIKSISVAEDRQGEVDVPLQVYVWLQEASGNEAVSAKYDELVALRDQLDRAFIEKDAPLPLRMADEMMREIDARSKECVSFDAGPTSKIRSAMKQADIPLDIQEDVMSTLQLKWQRAR